MGKRRKSEKKPFDQLTITDNYMFQAVMRDPDCVKPLLEMVIGKAIRKIVFVEPEKTQETGYNSRGIRMDVYIEDDKNTVYDVEMQASRKRHLGKRFRYYQSAIDVSILNKGKDVGKLKTSYIIFITTYDPFGKGWYVYPFETSCVWDPAVKMNDASTWYVLNAMGTKDAEGHEVSEDIKQMLSWMNGAAPMSEYTKKLDEAVKEVKQSEERRRDYMMSIYPDAAEEREIGNYGRVVALIRNNNGFLSDEQMLVFMHITPSILKNVRYVINEHPDWDDEDVADEVLDMEDEQATQRHPTYAGAL